VYTKYINICVYVFVCLFVWMFLGQQFSAGSAALESHVKYVMYIFVYMIYTCIHVYIYMCIYIYIYMCI